MKKVLFVLVAIICVVGVVKAVEVVANRNQPSVKDMIKTHIIQEKVIKERVLNETRRQPRAIFFFCTAHSERKC